MARSAEAIINHDLLIWARESAGLTTEEAAKKARVSKERLENWEQRESRLSISQLRNLSSVYKRPIAVFYLPERPKDFEVMHDFRRFPGEILGLPLAQLRYEIRRAHQRREIALELYQDLEGEPPTFSLRADIEDNPEEIANRIRTELGIKHEDQTNLRAAYMALRYWREAIEDAGILVSQATGVDRSEMRGFSISKTPFPAIVVNSKDAARARIFTMLHELAHIMLRRAGLCDLSEESGRPPEEQTIEILCNRIAGATLVPKESLLSEQIVVANQGNMEWSDNEINSLSYVYGGASREVILRRLLIFGRTTDGFYQMKRAQYQKEYASLPSPTGGPPWDVKYISRSGKFFTQLVLDSYRQEHITASDVADFLEIKLKWLPHIEDRLHNYGRSLIFPS